MPTVTGLGTDTTEAVATRTVTVTPATNDLIVIISAYKDNIADTLPTDNNADGLGTYTQVVTALQDSGGSKAKMFVRNGLIGSATPTTFTHAMGAPVDGILAVLSISRMGKYGSAAIKQTSKQENLELTTPAPAWTDTGAYNPTVGVIMNESNPAGMTKPASFSTEIYDIGMIASLKSPVDYVGMEVVKNDAGVSVNPITWGSASASGFCSMVAEFDATISLSVDCLIPNIVCESSFLVLESPSALPICNLALNEIGVDPIVDFYTTNQGRATNQLYGHCRDTLLRLLQPRFSYKRASLVASSPATLTVGEGNIFDLPSDCLAVIKLVTNDETIPWNIEGQTLITEESTAKIVYIARIEDVKVFDELYKRSLVLYLASTLAMTLKRDQELSDKLYNKFAVMNGFSIDKSFKEAKLPDPFGREIKNARWGEQRVNKL